MKFKIISLLFFLQMYSFAKENSFAIFLGMGVNQTVAPRVTDFVSSLNGFQENSFATTVEFFGGCEFPLDTVLGGKIEYSYLFKLYTIPSQQGGAYTLFYKIHSPTIIVHYVFSGNGYFLKFGGGVGYCRGEVDFFQPLFSTTTHYSSNGVGLQVEGVAQTTLGDNLFGYINANMRGNFLGDVKDSNGKNLQTLNTTAVSLSSFSIGLRFGVIYYF